MERECIQGRLAQLYGAAKPEQSDVLDGMLQDLDHQTETATNAQCVYNFECPAKPEGCGVKVSIRALGKLPLAATSVALATCRSI